MPPVIIQNPILNAPYTEPTRHWRFVNEQITDTIDTGRRSSSYFLPIAQTKKKAAPTLFDNDIEEKKEESVHVNNIRQQVRGWRVAGWPDVTPVTRALLEHWHDENRERKLFFCQLEALETLIFITECAKQTKYGQDWIETYLKEKAAEAGTELFRVACKMATGSGKTVVMSMLVAWQVLNKRRYPQDKRFTDSFLVVAPGITIRDRLRVLLPSAPGNYYRQLDIVPDEYRGDLGTAKIVVTNFHAFKLRERGDAGGLTKRVLTANTPGAFTESPDEMVNRVCNELGKHREIMVINDEAHHCYRGRPAETKGMTAEEKKEAKARDEEARLWITGLEAVHKKIGIKAVFDLSATPFYLKGSGYPEGTLFPWVVSDFSLMDAIESGIVKIPRVPVAENAISGEYPKYRNLWADIRDGLKDVRRGPDEAHTPPLLPGLLEGALKSLYGHYQHQFEAWEADQEGRANGSTPPVFIVVCNNTNVSKAVFDYVAGYETGHEHADGEPVVAPGALALFNNEKNQRWLHRQNTILVDSRQLESGESMSDDFKRLARHQIDEFKSEYRRRFPGRDTEKLTDEDLMREVLNTVGKKGKLGENVRCVVSVSMLTEGWDCNTVTHILGVRAFGTRLLCEQVMGRGLRRMSYTVGDDGMMTPEYADIFGVPFSGFPVAGLPEERAAPKPKPGKTVCAVPERLTGAPWLEVKFPRVVAYRFDVPAERLSAKFDHTHREVLTTDIPTWTENAPIVGEHAEMRLDDAKGLRTQAVAFKLATHLQQHHFPDKPWLFPQLLGIVREWLGDPDGDSPNVEYGDDTFPGLLLIGQNKHAACEKIARAIIASSGGAERLRAELQPGDAVGTTANVSFDTIKTCWTTDPTKCHFNLVPQDSDWETAVCQRLESMEEVRAYAKNQGVGFRIPYTCDGRAGNYYPDLIVKLDDGRGERDLLNLVLEVSGQKKKEKDAKVQTARTLWVPGVNNLGTFGRWAFLEIDGTNLHKTKQEIRTLLKGGAA